MGGVTPNSKKLQYHLTAIRMFNGINALCNVLSVRHGIRICAEKSGNPDNPMDMLDSPGGSWRDECRHLFDKWASDISARAGSSFEPYGLK